MQHLRPVTFEPVPSTEFSSTILADRTSGVDGCMVLITCVPPGRGSPDGTHIHPSDQLYYVLEGSLNVELDGRAFVVGPDSLVIIPAGIPHRNWNQGSAEERHLELIVPHVADGQPVTIAPGTGPQVRPATVLDTKDCVRRLDRSLFDADNWDTQMLASRSSGLKTCWFYVGRVPSGQGGPGHHIHPFDQFYFILEGELHLDIGLQTIVAGTNTLVVLPAGLAHRQWNEGPKPEMHICFGVPEPESGAPLDVPLTFGKPEGQAT
jgi:mannose-6-phosphate isomerase-like protein (cupin superfamily)